MESAQQDRAPVGLGRPQKGVLDGQREAIVNVALATALRPAHMNPLGGPIPSAAVLGVNSRPFPRLTAPRPAERCARLQA